MTDVAICKICVHYRPPNPPDPFVGLRLFSKKTVELRSKWRQEMVTRARAEYQKLESGEPFAYEPFAVAWCDHYSRPPEGSGDDARVFVPCSRQNPNDDCPDYRPQPDEGEADG